MFNIDASELILLLILGVVMFGPEKLPMFARKAARVFVAVRNIANNAQTQLREELGPEYSDLKLEDLNPKKIAAIEEAKREISTVSSTVKAAAEMTASTAVTNDSMIETDAATLALLAAPYDPEAT